MKKEEHPPTVPVSSTRPLMPRWSTVTHRVFYLEIIGYAVLLARYSVYVC